MVWSARSGAAHGSLRDIGPDDLQVFLQALRRGSMEALEGDRIPVCERLQAVPGGAADPLPDSLDILRRMQFVDYGGPEFVLDP